MSTVNQLKNKARREEQRENWSRAIEYYTKALDASRSKDEGFADLSLYNRIGDIYLRIGQKNTAVRYYEQAIERYSAQDLHTSAIALCNKVLRILPDRSTVFLQLGRLHLSTNLIADARGYFHSYATSMRERGGPKAAYEALEELIGLTGDRPTLSLWVSWLTAETDEEVVEERVAAARDALEDQGLDPDEVLEKIRTGDASDLQVGPAAAAEVDPLAGAFLSMPDDYVTSRIEVAPLPGASETEVPILPLDHVDLPLLATGPVAEDVLGAEDVDLSHTTGDSADPFDEDPDRSLGGDPVGPVDVDALQGAPEGIELGSQPWQDEDAESSEWGHSPLSIETTGIEKPENVEPDVAAVFELDSLRKVPGEDVEIAAEGEWALDLERQELEGLEQGDPMLMRDATSLSFETVEGDTGFEGDAFQVPPELETSEPPTVRPHQPGIEVAAASLEAFEPDEVQGSRAPAHDRSTEGPETAPVVDADVRLTPVSPVEFERITGSESPPRQRIVEPPEVTLAAVAIPVRRQSAPLDPDEDRAVATSSAPWDAAPDLSEASAETAPDLAISPSVPCPDASEPAAVEHDKWVAGAYDEIGRVMNDAADAAAAQAAAAKSAAQAAEAARAAAADAEAAEAAEAAERARRAAEEAEAARLAEQAAAAERVAAGEAEAARLAEEAAAAAQQAAAEEAEAARVAEEAAAAEQAAAEEAEAARVAEEAAAAQQAATEEAEAARVAEEAAAAEQAAAEEAEVARVAEAAAAAERAAAEEAEVARVAEAAAAAERAAAEEAEVARVAEAAAAAEQAAVDVAEPTGADRPVQEAETIALEVPHDLAAPPGAAAAMDEEEPSARTASGVSQSQSDIEESRPLAEPRSASATEDPADAFSDWVASASNAVLRRALPELEERSEREKALLVITQLAKHEKSDVVDYRRKYVDALEQLGRIEEALEACLQLASALESLQRPIEARDAYGRVLALAPGDPRAQQGLQRLEEFLEESDGVQHEADSPKPYAPSHVSIHEPTMIATHERPSNGTTVRNGSGRHGSRSSEVAGLEENPRPYSGVAGGVEASSDFEALLSEFRAELSEKPMQSDSMSRTEFGASLKEMGRLDDAIRELQAAVREPSAPPIAYELLGEAFLEKGQSRIAMRLLEKALTTLGQTDRELLGVLYQLGLTYEVVEDPSNALVCYERIFSVDIDYRDVQVRILNCSS